MVYFPLLEEVDLLGLLSHLTDVLLMIVEQLFLLGVLLIVVLCRSLTLQVIYLQLLKHQSMEFV